MSANIRNDWLARVIAYLVGLLPIAYFALTLDWTTLKWSPDTRSFVEMHAYQQPLYGIFFRTMTGIGLSEGQIALTQLGLFTLALMWLLREAVQFRLPRIVLYGLILIWWFPLMVGLQSLAVSFISEALFYPMLMVFSVAALRYARTGQQVYLCLAIIMTVAVVFVRGAAIGILPLTLAMALFILMFGSKEVRAGAAKSLLVAVAAIGVIPLLLGRNIGQIQPAGDRSGYVLLPRVVMIPARLNITTESAELWARLNTSFIEAGRSLSLAERSMFESQLQEAVRFGIGQKLLLGEDLSPIPDTHRSPAVVSETQRRAVDLFKQAAAKEPLAYLESSLSHLWAMLTAGNYIGTESRTAVFSALRRVDATTWELAEFRTDYPLNRFDEPLKPKTALAYAAFRALCSAGSAVAFVVMSFSIFSVLYRKQRVGRETVGGLLVAAALFGHSAVVALSVFPDLRFVMANFILQWTLLVMAAAWVTQHVLRCSSLQSQPI